MDGNGNGNGNRNERELIILIIHMIFIISLALLYIYTKDDKLEYAFLLLLGLYPLILHKLLGINVKIDTNSNHHISK